MKKGPEESRREGSSKPESQRGSGKFGRFFKGADADGDGKVSAEEFFALERIAKLPEEKRKRIFERLDKDGNGSIEREEMRPPQHPDGGRPFPKLHELDTNKDGKVSFEEFGAGPFAKRMPPERLKHIFGKLDNNGDGSLSPEDMPKGRGWQRDGKGGRSREHDPRKLIGMLDRNESGSLSFDEFRQAPWLKDVGEDEQEDQFEKLDRNNDLIIDAADFPEDDEGKPRKDGDKGRKDAGSERDRDKE